ncbi:putative ferric-chelate reductase 1 isoform X2 [Myripristis murdjan]|uniref:Ferric-chelate reductase 1b n=1 Tax=Myripristis murdjan TaxID=586833 RepID=A0A667XKF4_9TELE|nr:putative ferric-chelate reductase 1 isoform X2 [Myripristis murdjan]
MWLLCFLLVILTGCADQAAGYSNGKVSIACGDMTPQHGYESSPYPPPYNITVDKSAFSPGDHITVSLRVAPSSSAHFKGFLIEARDAGRPSSPAVGSFILVDPAKSQLLQCGHTQGFAVSHRDSSKKIQVQAVWESPKNPPGQVQFFVTVVQKYKVYWVRIAGPVVSVSGATAVPTTITPAEVTSPAALPTAFSSADCGRSKSCLRDPPGCHPESDTHCFFLSFHSEEGGMSVMFELSGPAEGYVSFALSQDKWMGNDDVYLCVNDGHRGTINAAYVSGRTHPEMAPEGALRDQALRLANGVIQCRFRRNVLLPQMENRFDLNQSYFLFLAHGRAQHGLIHRHERQPLISTNRIVISGPPEDLSGSRSPLLIKFHGVLMLTGWMWMVSTAVLFARHFKHLCSHTSLLGHQIWFQVHRTMMVLAVGLTAVAFTLPFIYRGGWSKHAGSHPYIGCAVMALSIIQPIMAVLRPAPQSPRRIFFNWMHLIAGTTGQLLAAVCIFLGVGQQALLLPSPWCPAVLTGWLLWIVLADLLLLIHSHRLQTAGHDSTEDRQRIVSPQLESQRHGEISTFKKIVLVVFLLGNTGFQVALVKAITNV